MRNHARLSHFGVWTRVRKKENMVVVTSIGNDEMGASALRRRFNVRISASMAFRWCSRKFVWFGSMNSGVNFTLVLPTGNERERREERSGLLSRRQFPRPFMGLVGCGRSNGECPYAHSAVINLWFSTPHLQFLEWWPPQPLGPNV